MTCKGGSSTTMADLPPPPKLVHQIGRAVIPKQSPIELLRSGANAKSKRKKAETTSSGEFRKGISSVG